MDFQQPTVAQLLRVEEEMDVSFTSGESAGASSGFGDSNELSINTGPIPSPNVSTASSLFSECHYFQNYASRPELSERTHSPTSQSTEPASAKPSYPPYHADRHQAVVMEDASALVGPHAAINHHRLQSSPENRVSIDHSLATNHPSNNNSINHHHDNNGKHRVRSRYHPANGISDAHAHSVSLNTHVSPVSLATIRQGKELTVHHVNCSNTSISVSVEPDNGQTTTTTTTKCSPSPVGLTGRAHQSPCCMCRIQDNSWCAPAPLAEKNQQITEDKNREITHTFKSSQCCPTEVHKPVSSTKVDHRRQSIPGSHWAKELIGRLRSNTITGASVEYSDWKSVDNRSSCPSPRCSQDTPRTANTRTPHTPLVIVDPRRLPKTSGPASACLEFSKKPFNLAQSPSISSPIPVANNRSPCVASNNAASAISSSWKSHKNSAKVRWFSQSISGTSGIHPAEPFFGPSSLHTRTSSSTMDEFQGAVDILASRQQVNTPVGMAPARASIRVKRASESDRFLVISKSLSESKEDFSPCALEHFDDNRVYNTLFRHSTCYDVLPESGKLLMLDSRLGIVRAIHALLENGVQAAPIWHSATQRVTGLLSQELALHLLTSLLCHSKHGPDSQNATPTLSDHMAMLTASNTAHPTSIADGIRQWGAQQICDVLGIFHSDPDKSRYSPSAFDSALIVSPQTRLKKALCRLIHFSHRIERLSRCHPSANSQPMDTTDYRSPISSSMPSDLSLGHPNNGQAMHTTDPGAVLGRSLKSGPTPLPAPTHLIVMNATCGNVLGVLGVDRLLAYLRLRLDELPYSPQMLSTVDIIPGLRWPDRQRLFKSSPFGHRRRSEADAAGAEYTPEPPVLYPTTPCREALCSLTQWLPQLPAIPVIVPREGAAATAAHSALVGLIAPGDLLHYFLDGCPDTAANEPVSKILEVKLALCRFLHECVCHTQETLADVLDRMFRLRTSCLVLFDSPHLHGFPIGMVTAKDLLCAIVSSKPGSHHHHHVRHNSGLSHGHPSETSWGVSETPMEVFEDDLGFPCLDQLPIKATNNEACLPVSVSSDPASSSSSEETSSSSENTYSAQQSSSARNSREAFVPVKRQESGRCKCSCHCSNDSHQADVPMSTPEIDHAMRHTGPTCLSSRDSVAPRANQGVRFLVNGPGQTGSSSTASKYQVHSNNPYGEQRRNSGSKRGDEDDALFPMD